MPIHSRPLHRLTVCALFCALICVISPIAIPIGPVPFSLGLLGVLITAVTLPPAQSTASVAAFLALGFCGLPILAGGNAGAPAFFSPTGGYLWAYLLLTPTVSLLASRIGKSFLRTLLAILPGLAICYLCGTLWFSALSHSPLLASLPLTTLPFLPLDLLKAIIAALLSVRLKNLLKVQIVS